MSLQECLTVIDRCTIGFANPNHAAAMICALLPLCWGWRRTAWLGRVLTGVLFVALLLTLSRTGLIVAGLEIVAWLWCGRRGPGSRGLGLRAGAVVVRWKPVVAALAVAGAVAVCWMWPRLVLDGSILNRPKIWLAGLRLFAANPDGVGLGNSGAIASAFLLDGIPEIRTMISAHITLLAEFGWMVGWAWFAFIGLALCGVRESPRVGIAFAGLVLSGCSSTVFDWPVLFDFAEQGGLGMANWVLSWAMFALFVGLGVWLIAGMMRRPHRGRPAVAVALAGVAVLGLRIVSVGNAPQVCDGYVIRGEAPRTLALHDESWMLKTVAQRVKGGAVLPVRGVAEFPRELDWSGIDKVVLFGDCREWKHLVKGLPVECVEE